MFRVTDKPINLQELVDCVTDPEAGAVATFIGTTRARSPTSCSPSWRSCRSSRSTGPWWRPPPTTPGSARPRRRSCPECRREIAVVAGRFARHDPPGASGELVSCHGSRRPAQIGAAQIGPRKIEPSEREDGAVWPGGYGGGGAQTNQSCQRRRTDHQRTRAPPPHQLISPSMIRS